MKKKKERIEFKNKQKTVFKIFQSKMLKIQMEKKKDELLIRASESSRTNLATKMFRARPSASHSHSLYFVAPAFFFRATRLYLSLGASEGYEQAPRAPRTLRDLVGNAPPGKCASTIEYIAVWYIESKRRQG